MRLRLWMILGLLAAGCGTPHVVSVPDVPQEPAAQVKTPADSGVEPTGETPEPSAEANACPTDLDAPEVLPRVPQSAFALDTWLGSPDVLMTTEDIAAQNRRFYAAMNDLDASVSEIVMAAQVHERLNSFRQKFEDGEITLVDGSVPDLADYSRAWETFREKWGKQQPTQHVMLEDAAILCAPHDAPYIRSEHGEVRFDRNRCSLARAQSRVEVFYEDAAGLRFVRTRDMWGWISPSAKLGPALTGNEARGEDDGRWFTTREVEIAGRRIVKGSFLAGTVDDVLVATETGFERVAARDVEGIVDTHRPLTRDEWVRTLFLFLGDPYGWGGWGGWRDCSRLMLDTARSFRLWLPRNSKEQAVQASYFVQVEGLGREAKMQAIEDAARAGIVMLHFPGHIMAWLGRADDGTPIVLHAFSEYLQACPEGGTSLVHVDRVSLSDLRIGEGTPRGSFLDRITHIAVFAPVARAAGASDRNAWPITADWTPAQESLYSAFVARLFDYPDVDQTWTNLGDVLRDADHNILYNSLGLHEDDEIVLTPDCADLPYMLRAYFAWKRGLPMASRKCGRGGKTKPPHCGDPQLHTEGSYYGDVAKRFNTYALLLGAFRVQSGNARTALDDDETDFYPVSLTRDALRPGTTYADPYGHLLVIAHYRADADGAPGAMFAVDAQPDGTITRKRFWRGNFLFAPEVTNAGAGFKAFRPVQNGRQLANAELDVASGFVPFSMEQAQITADAFYDRVDAAIHPQALSLDESVAELTDALLESAQKRVTSVQNGDDYARKHGSDEFVMPLGYTMFETEGPWEDYSTPSRDMRLLSAIDSVLAFPQQIRRNAARYGLETDAEIEDAVQKAEAAIAAALREQSIAYQNSRGIAVTLTLQDLVERAPHLEMAYHPADCNEVRWGAPEGSDEMRSCSRRAPKAEQQKMEKMRTWFHKRIRPPR